MTEITRSCTVQYYPTPEASQAVIKHRCEDNNKVESFLNAVTFGSICRQFRGCCNLKQSVAESLIVA